MASIGVNLTNEEYKDMEHWHKCGAIVIRDFTYEYDNIFYEIKVDTISHSDDGCSYYFKSVCGNDININIHTITRNPAYFIKIEK